MGVLELAFSVLRIDPVAVPHLVIPLQDATNIFVSLHKEASGVICVLFTNYPHHRQSILLELLSLLSQVYIHALDDILNRFLFNNYSIVFY